MKNFTNLIIRFRKAILIVMIIILLLSVAGTLVLFFGNKINSDMLVYLPDGSVTSDGIKFLQEEFDIKGDAMVVIEGTKNDEKLKKIIKQVSHIEGVTQSVWVGSLDDLDILAGLLPGSIKVDTATLRAFLKQPTNPNDPDSTYNYILICMINYSPSTNEAFAVLDNIENLLKEEGRTYAVEGMTATARIVMRDTLKEMPLYLIFGILTVVIILLLTTRSYIEPLILLITLGISIIVNMGTNLIFPSISIISFAASSVLQMGISMDYAIFYMHTYRKKRETMCAVDATVATLPETMNTILASSLTTMGGFLALFFMRFKIGADIGGVIVKGVALSLLTVIFIQPCLTIMLDKVIQKTTHKNLELNYKPLAKFVINKKTVICALALALIIPTIIGQSLVKFSYFEVYKAKENPTSQELLALDLRNQLIIAVPLYPKDSQTHKDFIKEIKSFDSVISVMGAFEALDIDLATLETLIKNPFMPAYAKTFFREVDVNGVKTFYTLYTIAIQGSTEDDSSFVLYNDINVIVDKYFDNKYEMGMLTGVNDMRLVTPKDFLIVTAVSVALILIIMSILLKSFRKSLVMVVLIELGIWINITLNYIFGASLNFMVYILISSVQLGCTVDYAILISSKYEECKRTIADSKEAAKEAVASGLPAVITSASIITGVCMAVFLVSKNLIVREMTFLLARGAVISLILVIFVLPGLLALFKHIRPLKEEIAHIKELKATAKEKAKKKKAENN